MTAGNILNAIKYLGDSGDSFLDIENYEKYRFSTERIECHHRRETDEGKTRQQLIDEGKYYNVKAEDLIFLTNREHAALHTTRENNLNFGKPLSEEHKQKIAEANKGKTRTEETRKRISESHKRENLSDGTLKKMSESHQGKTPWNKGKTLSIEIRQTLSTSQQGRHWYNDGTRCVRAKECPNGFKPGRI